MKKIFKGKYSIISLLISMAYFILPAIFVNEVVDFALLKWLTMPATFPFLAFRLFFHRSDFWIYYVILFILIIFGWAITNFVLNLAMMAKTGKTPKE